MNFFEWIIGYDDELRYGWIYAGDPEKFDQMMPKERILYYQQRTREHNEYTKTTVR